MDSWLVLAKAVTDMHSASERRLRELTGERSDDEDELIEGTTKKAYTEEPWFKDPLNNVPYEGIPARNKKELVDLEALLRDPKAFRKILRWILAVIRETRNQRSDALKSKCSVAIAGNCIIGRFDLVVELTGSFVSFGPTLEEQRDPSSLWRMVSDNSLVFEWKTIVRATDLDRHENALDNLF